MRTVIIGAGSAGAVIASRLTESSGHDVQLLEAGPDYGAHVDALPDDLRDGSRNSLGLNEQEKGDLVAFMLVL